MIEIRDYDTPLSLDRGRSGEINDLPPELPSESDNQERIVTTLYAKPSTGQPLLNLAKLKKGVYEETTHLSLRSYILFSDIGRSVWKAALEINKNSTAELVKSSMLEEDKSWQVMIRNLDLTALVNSVRFRPMGKYQSTFYISIEIISKPALLMVFLREIMEVLNRKPWVDQSGELSWKNFTKKTSTSRKEVIEQWALFSGLPMLDPDDFEAIDARGMRCPRPTIELAKACRKVAAGSIIRVIADDLAFESEVRAWCDTTGNRLVELEKVGKETTATIEILEPKRGEINER